MTDTTRRPSRRQQSIVLFRRSRPQSSPSLPSRRDILGQVMVVSVLVVLTTQVSPFASGLIAFACHAHQRVDCLLCEQSICGAVGFETGDPLARKRIVERRIFECEIAIVAHSFAPSRNAAFGTRIRRPYLTERIAPVRTSSYPTLRET